MTEVSNLGTLILKWGIAVRDDFPESDYKRIHVPCWFMNRLWVCALLSLINLALRVIIYVYPDYGGRVGTAQVRWSADRAQMKRNCYVFFQEALESKLRASGLLLSHGLLYLNLYQNVIRCTLAYSIRPVKGITNKCSNFIFPQSLKANGGRTKH